jgi:hypothetical protein
VREPLLRLGPCQVSAKRQKLLGLKTRDGKLAGDEAKVRGMDKTVKAWEQGMNSRLLGIHMPATLQPPQRAVGAP